MNNIMKVLLIVTVVGATLGYVLPIGVSAAILVYAYLMLDSAKWLFSISVVAISLSVSFIALLANVENNKAGLSFISSFFGKDGNNFYGVIFRKIFIVSLLVFTLFPNKEDLLTIGLTYASVSVVTNEKVVDTVSDMANIGTGLAADVVKRIFIESGLYTKDELEQTIKEIRGEIGKEKPVDKNG